MLIHAGFNKLVTAWRTAVENGEGVLDKEVTSHDDLFDAFRMSLMFGIWLQTSPNDFKSFKCCIYKCRCYYDFNYGSQMLKRSCSGRRQKSDPWRFVSIWLSEQNIQRHTTYDIWFRRKCEPLSTVCWPSRRLCYGQHLIHSREGLRVRISLN